MSEPLHDHHDEPRARRSHFTISALLVVIAVILLAVVLIVPAIQAARESARRNQCHCNLKQIGLGLQTYADINKCFPYDALWGQYPNNQFDNSNTKQGPYHYPWSVAITPMMTPGNLYNAINKRMAIWNQSQQYGTGGVPQITPPAYFGYIQSQQIPPYRCPSDIAFTGPDDLPRLCMWSNYAGNVGVGFYSAELKPGSNGEAQTTAPMATRGLFAFNDPVGFDAIRDGTSNTIAVAEVSSSGAVSPRATGEYPSDLAEDLVFAADSDQPLPIDWSLRGAATDAAWSPGPLLAGGRGRRRADFIKQPGGPSPVKLVFRESMIAFTESLTGSGPCSLPDTYRAAEGGPCGEASGQNAVAGFEFAGNVGAAGIVGIAPLYNALYSPNSNWPGPDSSHPGVVLVVFADGHSGTIQDSIHFPVWASLNTREGCDAF